MDHIHQRMYFTNKDKLIAYKLMIKKKIFLHGTALLGKGRLQY